MTKVKEYILNNWITVCTDKKCEFYDLLQPFFHAHDLRLPYFYRCEFCINDCVMLYEMCGLMMYEGFKCEFSVVTRWKCSKCGEIYNEYKNLHVEVAKIEQDEFYRNHPSISNTNIGIRWTPKLSLWSKLCNFFS